MYALPTRWTPGATSEGMRSSFAGFEPARPADRLDEGRRSLYLALKHGRSHRPRRRPEARLHGYDVVVRGGSPGQPDGAHQPAERLLGERSGTCPRPRTPRAGVE